MRLVDKHQQRAEAIADEVQPEDFRRLLYYLIDTVLEHLDLQPTPLLTLDPVSRAESPSPS
jgi:hypothetical protein